MAKTATKEVVANDFEKELAEHGLTGFFQNVLDRIDMNVEVLTTGLPRLDKALHENKLGLPLGRRIEIYSKDPEVGKTSLALQIGKEWQRQGKRVAIVDIEDTITTEYLQELGYVLDPEEGSNMYPVYLAKGFNEETGEVLSAEEIADKVGTISHIVDLVIIDSLAALAKRADLERDPNDASQPGGVGKILYDHCRKNTHVRATAIWINQALPQIGVFSPAGIKYKTSGGNAIPFFASIRIELRLVEKLKRGKEGEEEIYGVVIDAFTAKNKVSPPYKHVKITYLNGEGFSTIYDLWKAGLDAKVIEKSGGWFSINSERLGNGESKCYDLFKTNTHFQEAVQKALEEKKE